MVVFAFRTSRVSSYVQMQSFLPSGEVHEHVDDGPGRAFLISGSVGGRAASGWRAGGRFEKQKTENKRGPGGPGPHWE